MLEFVEKSGVESGTKTTFAGVGEILRLKRWSTIAFSVRIFQVNRIDSSEFLIMFVFSNPMLFGLSQLITQLS